MLICLHAEHSYQQSEPARLQLLLQAPLLSVENMEPAAALATLRQALLVLIQHNYVACYLRQEAPTLRGPGPQYQLYEAALPRILQILR